jgi:hypothetical protein
MLGFHQALDHLDGFFLGVTSVRGIVRRFRLEWNHVATSSLGWMAGAVNCFRNGVRAGHGVSSQFGHGWAEKEEGGGYCDSDHRVVRA